MKKNDVASVLEVLSREYFGAKCALNFNSPYELLISTILSAQCTDERVNIVTGELFKYYNTPERMVELTEEGLSKYIKSAGFYNNKSKNIIACSRMLIDKHNGQVPKTMEELTELAGVGRKTANVVLSNAYGIPGIAVDTHVFRVSNRLGLANGNTPEEVEVQLMKSIPKHMWSDTHHYIIWHGRKVCNARKPACEACPLAMYCKYFSASTKAAKVKKSK